MIYEPQELSDVRDMLTPEFYAEIADWRCIDPGHEVLQVLADALKPEGSESGKNSTCQRRWTLGSWIRVKNKSRKFDGKARKVGQGGNVRGHRFG
jgi:hypothetical protein